MSKRKRQRPLKDGALYRQVWRVVQGAVDDAFYHHPEYLTDEGRSKARSSICKRVTGAFVAYAAEVAKRRSAKAAAETVQPRYTRAEQHADGWQMAVGRCVGVSCAVGRELKPPAHAPEPST